MVNFLDRIRAKKATTDIEQITNDQSPMTNKVIKDGRLLILHGEKTFTVTGQEVR